MKYLVLLGDGMADYPLRELGGKTPLQVAAKPNMDRLAKEGVLGLVRTVPPGLPPGSDVANLAVLGYDPQRYYTGRSPLEAAGMGVELGAEDVTFRCNLVTLSDEAKYEEKKMVDYSAGEISSEEAALLIKDLAAEFNSQQRPFIQGELPASLVWRNGPLRAELTPPHDIRTGSSALPPAGEGAGEHFLCSKRASGSLPNTR